MNKERLKILKLLEKGEISTSEADHLLEKFETQNRKFQCHNCVYNHDDVDTDDVEKNLLH